MIAVLFEVYPDEAGRNEYLAITSDLRERLAEIPGFISIERFQSLADPEKMLSVSFWENEAAVSRWRELEEHRHAQGRGRNELFRDYRIRVGHIVRDYSLTDREQAPGE